MMLTYSACTLMMIMMMMRMGDDGDTQRLYVDGDDDGDG